MAQAGGTFRATVTEVLNDDSTVVTQIGIEPPPGSTIEVSADKGKSGPGNITANGRVQLVVFADRVELKGAPTDAVKFLIGYKVGSITSSTSETDRMPAGAKKLADILTVHLKSGEYKSGEATKLVTFKGVAYSLLVTKPK